MKRSDYRAVLAAAEALGAAHRDVALTVRSLAVKVDDHTARLERLETRTGDTNARTRPLEEGQQEIKDLLIRALER